jgi:hypothetical protein
MMYDKGFLDYLHSYSEWRVYLRLDFARVAQKARSMTQKLLWPSFQLESFSTVKEVHGANTRSCLNLKDLHHIRPVNLRLYIIHLYVN